MEYLKWSAPKSHFLVKLKCFINMVRYSDVHTLTYFFIKPFTPEGFPIDEQNCLVLDRAKSISAIWHFQGFKTL